MNITDLELIIGLEIHMHLNLESKMFCRCSAKMYGAPPNTHTCPTCLGLPGALPVPNRKAIEYTQLLGLALNCSLNEKSKFDRKNYFYPDLPKGYQISQYDEPLCFGGSVKNGEHEIRITRVHLEEDTGKSIHEKDKTLLDFNKSGLALVEIVTEPDFRSAKDAVWFAKLVQRSVRYLGISEVDMEKGQLRLEANISMRPVGEQALPKYKVEVKNINSFRFLEKAIEFEAKRQAELLKKGVTPVQENRGWDDVKQVTLSQREKEEAHDYRYFPEPDIPPMQFSKTYIESLKAGLVELPLQAAERLLLSGVSKESAEILTESRELLALFEEVSKETDTKRASNFLINKVELRSKSAKDVVAIIKQETEKKYINEDELKRLVEEIIKDEVYRSAVKDIKSGKSSAMAFLTGAVMKKSQGKADPRMTQTLLKQAIDEFEL